MLSNQDKRQLTLLLLGYDVPGVGRLYSKDGHRLPQIAVPLRRHVREINRFAFSGGITASMLVEGSPAKSSWLSNQVSFLHTSSSLVDWHEGLAIDGKLGLAIHPKLDRFTGRPSGYFKVKAIPWPYVEIIDKQDKAHFTAVVTCECDHDPTLRDITVYTPTSYIYYEDIPQHKSWAECEPSLVEEHPYTITPFFVATNNAQHRPEFDQAALDLACEITQHFLNTSESLFYFGSQIIESTNPEELKKAIRKRERVVRGRNEQNPVNRVLKMEPLPEANALHIKRLAEEFGYHMGTPLVELNQRSDISSLAMKLGHAATIATAQIKYDHVVGRELTTLLENMLVMAAFQGTLADVYTDDPLTYRLTLSRNIEPFPTTPSEKEEMLNVVAKLISLGIDPAHALSSEYYLTLTPDELSKSLQVEGGFTQRENISINGARPLSTFQPKAL